MKMMDPDQSFTPREERQLLQSVAALLEASLPQSETTQCPSCTDLRNLARRRIRLADADSLVDHLGVCPRCFKSYSEFRAQHKTRVRALYTAFALAAGVVIAAVLLQPLRPHVAQPNPPAPIIAKLPERSAPAVAAVLDLTKLGVARSDSPVAGDRPQVGSLPCARVTLSVHLPVGSEDGRYDVALLRKSGESVVSSSGNATLQNYVEVLGVEIDLSSVAPGNYSLAIRQAGSSWREYPIALVPKETP
jgi:hypothetical protein